MPLIFFELGCQYLLKIIKKRRINEFCAWFVQS